MSNEAQNVAERMLNHQQHLIGLLWHLGAYFIIGVLLIVLDLIGAGGLSWSFWILGFWFFGLALHVLAYLVDGLRE